jgi:hypothetical protein
MINAQRLNDIQATFKNERLTNKNLQLRLRGREVLGYFVVRFRRAQPGEKIVQERNMKLDPDVIDKYLDKVAEFKGKYLGGKSFVAEFLEKCFLFTAVFRIFGNR